MKLYRCELCGRVFNQKMPHKCYGGCFRKHSLTFTEFEDIDNEYIKCDYEYQINWKQARVDAAIGAMNGILSRKNNLPFNTHEKEVCEEVARISAVLADALIAELKKINETK